MYTPSLNIGKKGIEKVLGTLEAGVMDILWKSKDPVSAREVTDTLAAKKAVSFNAISTVLTRLEAKALITRHAVGKRYRFSAVQTKQQFVRSILMQSFQALFTDKELLSAAGIDGNAPEDPNGIAALEAFLDEYDSKDKT